MRICAPETTSASHADRRPQTRRGETGDGGHDHSTPRGSRAAPPVAWAPAGRSRAALHCRERPCPCDRRDLSATAVCDGITGVASVVSDVVARVDAGAAGAPGLFERSGPRGTRSGGRGDSASARREGIRPGNDRRPHGVAYAWGDQSVSTLDRTARHRTDGHGDDGGARAEASRRWEDASGTRTYHGAGHCGPKRFTSQVRKQPELKRQTPNPPPNRIPTHPRPNRHRQRRRTRHPPRSPAPVYRIRTRPGLGSRRLRLRPHRQRRDWTPHPLRSPAQRRPGPKRHVRNPVR